MQPSDARIKTVIREMDPREQLQNVNKIKIVQYKYRPEFLNQLPEEDRHRLGKQQTGIIAQDVREVIPEAVCSSGSYSLSNGREINNMLIVNKDRLFLENLGAVRELSKVCLNMSRFVFSCRILSKLVYSCRNSSNLVKTCLFLSKLFYSCQNLPISV